MEHTDPVIQTLLDRIAIQDLFTRYYGSLDAVVTADSGLPDLFDQTYTPREDFRL
jgi:hypothetical protein